MNPPRQRDVVLEFIGKINQHDPEGLAALMTESHKFIDSLGRAITGRDELRNAWSGYFRLFPDYRIAWEEIFERDNVFAVFGTASGTYCDKGEMAPENQWLIPAAWRAVVRDGRIAEWRVYADNFQTVKLLQKR